MSHSMERFKAINFPLHGKRLIEASAGTGKTYNISNLYLRLITGANGQRALGVREILVVTFTRAAAMELAGRIRGLLQLAWQDLRAGSSEHEFVQQLMDSMNSPQREQAIERLYQALLSMDEASISTIHKFALNVVREFVFETGALADLEPEEHHGITAAAAVTDVYRQLSVSDDPVALDMYSALGNGSHQAFVDYFKTIKRQHQIRPDLTPTAAPIESLSALGAAYQSLLDEATQRNHQDHEGLLREWQVTCEQNDMQGWLGESLSAMGLGKNPVPEKVGADAWQHVDQLLRSEPSSQQALHCGKKLAAQRFGRLLEDPARWLPGKAQDQQNLALLQRVNTHLEVRPDEATCKTQCARALLAHVVQQRLARINPATPALDDLVDMVNARLLDEQAGPALRHSITERYPVCLVDEFQDTDPRQFEMFNRLYAPEKTSADTGLIMIGDPKQSIFAFRGADIFAYLNVRNQLHEKPKKHPALFSLDENFRSKARLVAATNCLFREPSKSSQRAGTFMFSGIEYYPVKASELRGGRFTKPLLRSGAEAGPGDQPLVFIGNPDDPNERDARLGKGKLVELFARDTAHRISRLLDPQSGHRLFATNEPDSESRALRPADIAVLVSNGREANAVRKQLARPEIGLRCVYISQKDSVFSDSEIAEDLYHILRAMNEFDHRSRLRTALATPLMRAFSYSYDEAERLESDDAAFESVLVEFAAYRETWLKHGVLTALNRLWNQAQRKLLPRIARRQDSDRLLTDLRHLGDLLEQQGRQCDAPEQLIRWYAQQLDDDSQLDEDARRIRLESDQDLVRISTIHVAKGLEFPVVFVPFFFMPWPVDLSKALPLHHVPEGEAYTAIVDFEGRSEDVRSAMTQEQMAEGMRLLYVAITRAIYQCYVGISGFVHNRRSPLFAQTPWAHLLAEELESIDESLIAPRSTPGWNELKQALKQRFADSDDPDSVGYCEAGDCEAVRFSPAKQQQRTLSPPPLFRLAPSSWEITSYSRLAHGKVPSIAGKNDDDSLETTPINASELLLLQQADLRWQENIRYQLPGGVHTGNALHDTLEYLALNPNSDTTDTAINQLELRGLALPRDARRVNENIANNLRDAYQARIGQWLDRVLDQPLSTGAGEGMPTLRSVFEQGDQVPEMNFDLRIGNEATSANYRHINQALVSADITALAREGDISGLMTGAIDLVFCHQQKFYLADYKSNLLGKAPRFYAPDVLGSAVTQSRYDLQYMIYSVALHRYLCSHLGEQYAFDGGEYEFGGVFYLYLRGMGLEAPYQNHGVWFHRPTSAQVMALDRALAGVAAGEVVA